MADGRMLKKVICESPRLAALKNDTHRLIYTWLIPHLDIEGRHSADPRIVKSHVAPILDHVTHKIIAAALNDMAVHNLIELYSVDGKQFLELQRFKKHQNLRESREKKSDIPPPTPGAVPEQSRITPIEGKGREVKGREANAREDLPVDNSKEASIKKESKKEPDALLDNLREIVEDIGSRMPEPQKQRQVMLFVEANIAKKNHAGMMSCLKSLQKQLQNGIEIEYPKAYLEAALKIEDGKYNAREYEEKAKQFKEPGMMSIGDILQGARASP